MSLDVVIRNFVPGDVTSLIALVNEYQTRAVSEDKEIARKLLLDYAKNPNSVTYFVAELDGKLIGYVEGLPIKDLDEDDPLLENVDNPKESYYCEEIFVTESQRGKGISKILKASIMNYAIEQGYKEIISIVSTDNTIALGLNRSLGMKEEPVRESIIFRNRLCE